MAGTTANRGYPYPTDGDAQNTAVHIENLADAVDADTNFLDDKIDAEQAARNAIDEELNDRIDSVISLGEVVENIMIQASLGEALLNVFGAVEFTFPIPFSAPPVVIANNAVAAQEVVIGVDHSGTTATKCVVFARNISDGAAAVDTNITFHWIAVGFRSP